MLINIILISAFLFTHILQAREVKVKNLRPRVSIITSLYNADQFIEPFLKDITSQNIFGECELILLNAHSPGHEEPIIKKYMKKYKNIIYKKFNKKLTIYETWNIGIQMASSEFITNANVDDRRSIDSLEVHAKALERDVSLDLVYADFYVTFTPNDTCKYHAMKKRKINLDYMGIIRGPSYWSELYYQNRIDYALVWRNAPCSLKNMRLNLPGPFPMWRKSLHNKYGYFLADFISAGDWEMWCRALDKGAKFAKINKILDLYYVNPVGLSTITSSPKRDAENDYILQRYGYLWR